jgi:hypothetical protein
MEINQQQLVEILADFSALGRPTYLDDPVLGLGYAATDRDELGIPQFSPDLPQVALREGRLDFGALTSSPSKRAEQGVTIYYIAFDLLSGGSSAVVSA